ncbi:MAG TPA: aspartate aminotransferase family protein [Polyangiaceae bacterium]|jgi:acetylornithine/N-succinyldiaminopimelate aminotransferase|nr:aspartate aminotransferase family protein [Polyangiaceae bacterium]
MTNSDEKALLGLAAQHLYPNYRQPACVFVRGNGCEVWDKSGKRYLDLAAGVAVSSLGHAHPRYVAAISEQVGRLVHMSNHFYNETNILLAAELCRRTRMSRAFFCSSGAEANETLLKLCRHHFYLKGQKDRYRVIAFEEAFHGRTLGALAMTGRAKYREGFGPYAGGVTHLPYGDLAAVERAMGADLAGIIVEPVQGEGGVLPAPPGFLAGLRRITESTGALLLLDEVQTGIGRTGTFLACEQHGVVPDAIALAKGLGGGFPIGAMLCREELAGALPPGSHGSTFGGNALAAAAALTVLAVLDDEKLIDGAKKKGDHLAQALAALCARHTDMVGPERGAGLLRAVPLKPGTEPRALLTLVRERGVLLITAGDSAIRFCPPLTVSEAQLDEGVRALDDALTAMRRSKVAEPARAAP